MVFDDYSMNHHNKFKDILNIYNNDNIDIVIDTFMKKNNITSINIKKEIRDSIIKMQNILEVLENRYITNIGSRIIDNSIVKFEFDQPNYYLIEVWRGKYII